MTKKLKLDYIPEFEFLLLGIVSYDRDYRLGWEINKELNIDLQRVDDHNIKHKKTGREQYFSCFTFSDENTYLDYKLLSNRSDNGFLLDDLRNIDYLIVITGEYYSSLAREMKNKLLKLESVQNCFIIQPDHIRDFENVL